MANFEDRETLNNDYQGFQTAAEISGPLLKALHILDMPPEILIKIFRFLEHFQHDSPFPLWHAGTKDIQRCRLTCRLFCNLSSELLIRLVRVDHRASRLSR